MSKVTIFDYLMKASEAGFDTMISFSKNTVTVSVDDVTFTSNSIEEMIKDHILCSTFKTLEDAIDSI